ncbi:MAG: adenylyl-sulfate kinase [Lentisphaerales bacterium]|nr:adenylyl-sulfate kinase [Lentisphaerales bacterium]
MNSYKWNKKTSIWFTGLSGAGKTTVSLELKKLIESTTDSGVILLDGDELVEIFSTNTIDRSEEGRIERVKKYLKLVGLLLNTPRVIPVVAMINHSQTLRNMIETADESGHCFLIYLETELKTCQQRDPKGHYARAAQVKSPNMIGLDLHFDIPTSPDVSITEKSSPSEAAQLILNQLIKEEVFIPHV